MIGIEQQILEALVKIRECLERQEEAMMSMKKRAETKTAEAMNNLGPIIDMAPAEMRPMIKKMMGA